MPARFSKIEPPDLVDHPRLEHGDECYYLYEYTSGVGFTYGVANDLISNLKKPMRWRTRPDVWRHKEWAISKCAQDISEAINPVWLTGATLVPIPPSKTRTDPDYDDRLERILQKLNVPTAVVDARQLLVQTNSTRASHVSAGDRVTIEELLDVYQIDESKAVPAPLAIGLVDDVLTAGNHFKAAQRKLRARFHGVPIVGFFIARRIFPV